MNAELLEAQMIPMMGSALYWGPTPTSEAIAYYDKELKRDIRSRVLQRFFTGSRAQMLGLGGRVDEAREILERNAREVEELGNIFSASSLRGFVLSLNEIGAGNVEIGVALIMRAADIFEAAGETAALSTLAGYASIYLYEIGKVDEALRSSERSERAAAPDDLASQIFWRAGRAQVLAARGDSEQGLHLANEAVAIAEGTEALMWHCDAYMTRGEVYRLLGRNEDAANDFGRAFELYEKKEAPGYAARARRKLAALSG
jgi:tetratricopeptide (TPR) repeat protein